MGQFRDTPDIDDLKCRVRWAFQECDGNLVSDFLLPLIVVGAVDKMCFDAEAWEKFANDVTA